MAATQSSQFSLAYTRFRDIDREIAALAGSPAVGLGQVSQAAVASMEAGVRPPDADRGALVDGPFVFVVTAPAAPIAPNTLVGDLTTYVGGATLTGPVSSNLFPAFTASNGQPDTLLFINTVKFEVDTDSLGNGAAIADLLQSLEMFVQIGQGQKTYRRNYPLAECGGTVTHYSSAATTNAATTLQNQHKRATVMRCMDIPPIYLPNSTFQIQTNGRGVPVAPSAITPIYVTCEGFAIHNVRNAFDIQNSWVNPTSGQREALDKIAALVNEKRTIQRAFGFKR